MFESAGLIGWDGMGWDGDGWNGGREMDHWRGRFMCVCLCHGTISERTLHEIRYMRIL